VGKQSIGLTAGLSDCQSMLERIESDFTPRLWLTLLYICIYMYIFVYICIYMYIYVYMYICT
jgi:hypothetical protein